MRRSVPEDAAVSSRFRLSQFLSANGAFIVVWLAMFIGIIGIAMVSPLLPVFTEEIGAGGIWLGLTLSLCREILSSLRNHPLPFIPVHLTQPLTSRRIHVTNKNSGNITLPVNNVSFFTFRFGELHRGSQVLTY